ncbi:SRPBCC family protein [Planctomicrobium sp. SH664]|uniref:SRPBCC family protein n=1 Tax=Planctomicrobium sp. SH664 TaxID=3448125 RepID=UPI003F5C37B9
MCCCSRTNCAVTRKITIAAPPAVVFPHVNNLHLWNAWSPWAKLDPEAKYKFEGPEAGAEAKMAWAGNSQVGEGTMTIIESDPDKRVLIRLNFVVPMECTTDTQFVLAPEGEQTELTWSTWGPNTFVTKAMGLFVNMDKLMGDQFEQGLKNLKTLVEAEVAKTPG